jgi:hypothetical protein
MTEKTLEERVSALEAVVYPPKEEPAVEEPVNSVPQSVRWPRVIQVGGVNVQAHAPIAPDWLPGHTAAIFGTGKGVLREPGRPFGARSPRGYPMINGRVHWNGETFEDEAALEVYRNALLARDKKLNETVEATMRTVYHGPVYVGDLNDDDKDYMTAWAAREGINLWLAVLNGTWRQIAVAVRDGDYGERMYSRGLKDISAYTGKCKDAVAAYLAGQIKVVRS